MPTCTAIDGAKGLTAILVSPDDDGQDGKKISIMYSEILCNIMCWYVHNLIYHCVI